MKGLLLGAGTIVLLLVIAVVAWRLSARNPPQELLLHCGTSMRPAAEELASAFTAGTGIAIRFNFGGSETLLPLIKTSRSGDLFICHDPFPADLQKEGLLAEQVPVGELMPVLVIHAGRSDGPRTLADLAKPGLKLGLLDPRYATCGQLTRNALAAAGIAEAVQANVVLESRSHGDLATAVGLGQLDAAVVWNFAARLHEKEVQAFAIPGIPPTPVVICRLTCAQAGDEALRFAGFAATPICKAIFARHGYTADYGKR